MGLLLAGSVASAADGVKVSGFAAPGFKWVQDTSNSFSVMDGAVYLSHSMDMAEVMVDIPFATSTAAGAGNNFAIATGKAQAYVGHKFDMGMHWKLGQFDYAGGYEGNDAPTHMFANGSVIVEGMLPVTHTGFSAGFAPSDMLDVNLIVANQRNLGTQPDAGTTGSYDSKYDIGASVNANMDTFKLGVHFLYGEVASSVTSMLLDVVASTQVSGMDLALDVVYNNVKDFDAQFGIGVQAGYAVSDQASFGARFEYAKLTTPTLQAVLAAVGAPADTLFKVMTFTVGPQYAVTKALKVKADYTLAKTEADASGADSETDHTVAVAAVYSF